MINSLWNEHSGGGTKRGDGSEVVQWPCIGGKATGTLRWQWKKTPMGENPVSPLFGGPAKTGTGGTGGERSE